MTTTDPAQEGQAPKNIFEVDIAGMPLKLKTTHDIEFVKKLVEFVDQKVNASLSQSKNGSVQNAILLAALNMAEELFIQRERMDEELGHLERKAGQLVSALSHSQEEVSQINNSLDH